MLATPCLPATAGDAKDIGPLSSSILPSAGITAPASRCALLQRSGRLCPTLGHCGNAWKLGAERYPTEPLVASDGAATTAAGLPAAEAVRPRRKVIEGAHSCEKHLRSTGGVVASGEGWLVLRNMVCEAHQPQSSRFQPAKGHRNVKVRSCLAARARALATFNSLYLSAACSRWRDIRCEAQDCRAAPGRFRRRRVLRCRE